MSNVLKYSKICISDESKFILENNNTAVYLAYKQDGKDDELKIKSDENLRLSKAQSDKIISDANKKAQQILDDAIKKSEAIKKQAYDDAYEQGIKKGYHEGYDDGILKAEKYMKDKLKSVDLLEQEIYHRKKLLYKQYEKEIINLAINISRKVLNDVSDENESMYLKIVAKALKRISSASTFKLRVSSSDYPIVIKSKPDLLSLVQDQDIHDIEVIEDEFLVKGSCIVDTDMGVIDSSIDTQIEKISLAFASLFTSEE